MSDNSATTGFLIASVTLLIWEYFRLRQQKEKFEDAYWGERRGRVLYWNFFSSSLRDISKYVGKG